MDIKDLKSTWDKLSQKRGSAKDLSFEEMNKIVNKKTLDITEKITRNIRIGTGIILGWICLSFAVDFLFTPVFEDILDKPYLTEQFMFWAFIIEAFNYVLIFTAIIIFWIRFNKFEQQEFDESNLNEKLRRVIAILESYQKMFYIVLVIIILYIIASFSSVFFMEYKFQLNEAGMDMQNISFSGWLIVVLSFILSLGIFIGIYYLLFNFFYTRLYGRYHKQLKKSLRELEEFE